MAADHRGSTCSTGSSPTPSPGSPSSDWSWTFRRHAMGYGGSRRGPARGHEDDRRRRASTGSSRRTVSASMRSTSQAKNYEREDEGRAASPAGLLREPRRADEPRRECSSRRHRSRPRRWTDVNRIPQRIVLIDGPTLARALYDHGIGVRAKRVTRRERRGRGLLSRATPDSANGCWQDQSAARCRPRRNWDQRGGGATGARTPDLLHAMQMLSQLSYRPKGAHVSRWSRRRP